MYLVIAMFWHQFTYALLHVYVICVSPLCIGKFFDCYISHCVVNCFTEFYNTIFVFRTVEAVDNRQ